MVKTTSDIWALLEDVPDPEVPVLSILDLGVVRDVKTDDSDLSSATITITPTYSGCPAMDMIAMGIRMKLLEAGMKHINIINQLSPAWTTDWMSEEGKRKLKAYGIAPPLSNEIVETLFGEDHKIQCPQCNSMNTELISQFGSTSCKALCRCLDCKEPFDYFKCHR